MQACTIIQHRNIAKSILKTINKTLKNPEFHMLRFYLFIYFSFFANICNTCCTLQLRLCDIEQLTTLGRETKTCPYYGSRLAIPSAEVQHENFSCLHQSQKILLKTLGFVLFLPGIVNGDEKGIVNQKINC